MLGRPWPGGRGGRFDQGTVLLLAVAAAVLCAVAFLQHVALLFQNLYQSSFIWLPGTRVAHVYWASVSYGLTMAALVGALGTCLAVIVAVELWRYTRRF